LLSMHLHHVILCLSKVHADEDTKYKASAVKVRICSQMIEVVMDHDSNVSSQNNMILNKF
jgi:hypothetical protein